MKIHDKKMMINISGWSTEYIPQLYLHKSCYYNVATPAELARDVC